MGSICYGLRVYEGSTNQYQGLLLIEPRVYGDQGFCGNLPGQGTMTWA